MEKDAVKVLNAARGRTQVYDQVTAMEEEWKYILEHQKVADNCLLLCVLNKDTEATRYMKAALFLTSLQQNSRKQ